MTLVLLIRHALNDWVGDRLAGWTPNVHLNDEGRQQALALAQRLATVELHAVYTSPLERAKETATMIAVPHGLEAQIREAIGEVRYGEWTGQELKKLVKDELWPAVQVYPSGTRFPGGETLREVQARAVTELDAICQAHPNSIVAVVSHADVIKVAVAHYAGLHLDLFQRLIISPASITALALGKMGPRIVRLNDTSHIPRDEPEFTLPEKKEQQAGETAHRRQSESGPM